MSITRTLTFNWSGLPQTTKILLCFQDLVENKLTSEQNYVAWKVIEARAGNGSANVTYTGRVGFAQSEIDVGNIVRGSTYVEMKQASSVEFIKGDDDLAVFGPVTSNPALERLITCKNKTGTKQDMSVGTFTSDKQGVRMYEPAFQWHDVGENISIKADFHPTLIAYVGLDYRKNQLITADLSGQEIWSKNLAALKPHTNWDFSETEQNGFKIESSD